MLKCALSERKNINKSEPLYLSHTHSHSLGCMSERRKEKLSQERDREQAIVDHLYVFRFYYCHWCSFYLKGSYGVFSFMVSPRKIICLLYLVFIAMHVILSDSILISYCLNDKNITLISCTGDVESCYISSLSCIGDV